MSKMSTREKTLMVILAILLAGALYYLFFLSPLQSKTEQLTGEISDVQDNIATAQVMLQKKQTMQKELDAIFSQSDGEPTKIPDYDNVQAVIKELNQILSASDEYSINFGSLEDSNNSIVRRPVGLSFSCGTYEAVRSILGQLGSSEYRSLITDVSVVRSDENAQTGQTGTENKTELYTVTADINFYEYSQTPVNPTDTAQQ